MVRKPLITQGYSLAEEVANSISHGIGLVFGIVGLVLLLVQAADTNASATAIASYSLYALSRDPASAGETVAEEIRPLRHLFADCRDLHAVFAGGVEFTAGEGADDRHLEPGAAGDPV